MITTPHLPLQWPQGSQLQVRVDRWVGGTLTKQMLAAKLHEFYALNAPTAEAESVQAAVPIARRKLKGGPA